MDALPLYYCLARIENLMASPLNMKAIKVKVIKKINLLKMLESSPLLPIKFSLNIIHKYILGLARPCHLGAEPGHE